MVNINTRSYIEGEKTTIRGTEFFIGDHAILTIAGFDKHFEGEVTGIGNHTIFLNGEMIQLNNCVGAEKLDLKIGKEKLERIKSTSFELGTTSELIQNSSKLILEMLLKHVENQILIKMSKFEKNSATLSATTTNNTKAGLVLAKEIVELLSEVDMLEGLKEMIKNRITQIEVEELTNEIKEGK